MEAFERIHCADRAEWLANRCSFIGASEAAQSLNLSPWGTAAELFDAKSGRAVAKDISDRPAVRYGVEMEPLVREQAMVELPWLRWEYHQFDILVSREWPWMSATLDGEVTVEDGANPWGFPVGTRGVYEGKTGQFRREEDLAEWTGENSIPMHYYAQTLHQLAVTGWQFVIVSARLRREGYRDSDYGFPEIRCLYRIVDRRSPSVREDIAKLVEGEGRFARQLHAGERPAKVVRI